MNVELDAADLRILTALQIDAGRTTAELAEAAGVSQSVCWRRVQRLKNEGVIRAQVGLLNRELIGLNAHIFAQVKLSAHGRANLAAFSDAIQACPEVLECYVMMGPIDFLLRIVAADIKAYEQFFFERLSQIPGVQEVNSIVALSEIKSTTCLPLPRNPVKA